MVLIAFTKSDKDVEFDCLIPLINRPAGPFSIIFCLIDPVLVPTFGKAAKNDRKIKIIKKFFINSKVVSEVLLVHKN